MGSANTTKARRALMCPTAIRTDSLTLLEATQAPLRSRFPKDSKSWGRGQISGWDPMTFGAELAGTPDWDRAHEEHRSEAPSYCLMSVHWGEAAISVAVR